MKTPVRFLLLAGSLFAGCSTPQPVPSPVVPSPVALTPVAIARPAPSRTRSAFQSELETRLSQTLQQASGLQTVWISDAPEGGVLIGLMPSAVFSRSQAVLRPGALGGLGQIESALLAPADSVVQILGPRSVTGSACPGYRMSAREARALESYWRAIGFPGARLRAQGRDDCPGIAGAPAPSGRLQILVRPAVAGDGTVAYRPLEVP